MRDARHLPPHRHAVLRVVVLSTAAVASTLRGLSYLPDMKPEGSITALTYADAWLPMTGWAWVWLALAFVLGLSTGVHQLAIPSMSVFVGMNMLWGLSYLASWIFLDSPRMWLTGSALITLAIFSTVLTSLIERPRASPLSGE